MGMLDVAVAQSRGETIGLISTAPGHGNAADKKNPLTGSG